MIIAGVDEAGRGPLAGPVVAAAVIIGEPIPGIDDSKKLTTKKRASLAITIRDKALSYAYGHASVEEINELNIHHATLLAMKRAVEAIEPPPELILVDGLYTPDTLIPSKAIVKGDSLHKNIAAASILAKVWRDEEMQRLDEIYPGYAFAKHKGYPTASHREALYRLGPCAIHRRDYAPVAAAQAAKSVKDRVFSQVKL